MAYLCLKNYNKLKEKYGNYSIGNLYLSRETKESIIEPIGCENVFDTKSFNYHLYPEDIERTNEIAKKLDELRGKIKEKFKERIARDNKSVIYLNGRKGNTAFNPLFKYIQVAKKDTSLTYNLTLFRFFVSDEKRINCVLGAVQFDCCVGDTVNKTPKGECYICYPNCNEQEKDLDDIINNANDKSFFYNPSIYFEIEEIKIKEKLDLLAEKIVMEFIDFINRCEA